MSTNLSDIALGGLAMIIAPAVGALGLASIGIRQVYDLACRSFYERKLAHAEKEKGPLSLVQLKATVAFYDHRLHQINGKMAKVFAWAFIPIAGVFALASKKGLIAVLVCVIADIVIPILGSASMCRRFLYPISGTTQKAYYQRIAGRKEWVPQRGGQFFSLPVTPLVHSDNPERVRHIDSIYFPVADKVSDRTMVLFHGNGMQLDAMDRHVDFFRQHGWNVLLTTMGGYPSETPQPKNFVTSPESTFADANAAVARAQTLGAKHVVLYGLSIGSTLAVDVAARYRDSDIVKGVILDQPLTSPLDVVKNTLVDVSSRAPLSGMHDEVIQQHLFGHLEPVFQSAGVALNNLSKIRGINAKLCVLRATADTLMNPLGGLDLPQKLYEAFNSNHPQDQATLLQCEGGHASCFFEQAPQNASVPVGIARMLKVQNISKAIYGFLDRCAPASS
jgi:pimeloyl-ACP methyl ester carboxylesterase